jgi:glucokinase
MILAGDVGGTKVRLALFEEKGGRQCVAEEKFASCDFPNFTALLKTYLSKTQEKKISSACFGVAGPVQDRQCKATNLPWEISASVLEKELKIPRVDLINDLSANAWGLRCLRPEEFFIVNVGESGKGNQALISAGTGLGEAGLYFDGNIHHPFACEGGHCDFAPKNDEEIDLFRYLKGKYPHVSYERILSGQGLCEIYQFLIDTKREKETAPIAALMKQMEKARVITEKGSSGECVVCVRACRLFTDIYGSESGNLALKFLAFGGVFIGGGIAPHLLSFIKEGTFFKSFCLKGRFDSLLSKIPVKVVLNDKTALLGAAVYAQEHQ